MPKWLKSHWPLRPWSLTTTRVSLEVCKLISAHVFTCPGLVLHTRSAASPPLTGCCSPCRSLQNSAQPSSSVRISARWGGGHGEQGAHGWGGGELGPGDESSSEVDWQGILPLWGQQRIGVFFVLHKFISYLQEGVKLQLSLFSWPHRASKQRTPLIIKCCSVGTTPPLWSLDICHRRSWSASPGWGYVVKEILTHHQTCLTHHGLTDGCCSRTFPLWRITSHIMTGSGLSCSPGSWSCFPRMRLRTKSCSPGSRSFLKGFFYCTFAVMFGIKLHSILISLLKI